LKHGEYDVMAQVETEHWWYRTLHHLVAAELTRYTRRASLRVMADAGCGTGGLYVALRNRLSSVDYVGIDVERSALAHCRRRGARKLVCGSVNDLPLGPGVVDAIVPLDVLYFSTIDRRRALRQLRATLRPGGILVLNLPAFEALRGRHDEAVGIERRFRRKEVESLLDEAGFRDIKTTYWNLMLFVPLLAWRWLSRLGSDEQVRSDLTLPFRWVNRLLIVPLRLEAAVALRWGLPFGSSVLAVARRAD